MPADSHAKIPHFTRASRGSSNKWRAPTGQNVTGVSNAPTLGETDPASRSGGDGAPGVPWRGVVR